MPTVEERLAKIEQWQKMTDPRMRGLMAVASALQGQPAIAQISIPHNDSWLFEDNLDATHPGNLRYVISGNVQRVVSARLSIHLAPYRTYNTLSVSATGTESAGHTHASAAHHHTMLQDNGTNFATPPNLEWWRDGNGNLYGLGAGGFDAVTFNTTPANTGGESGTHTHNVSATGVLGVTEGATATGVTIAFDGVDATAALGGPFSLDAVEINVLPFLPVSQGVFHVIALQPSAVGRIEAHLRLGVYVAAGTVF